MNKKIIIIGGVAGGASAAARLRRLDEGSEIIIFERGPHVSFSNCSLPYYLSDMIQNSNDLVMMNPEIFMDRFNIKVKVNSEVIKINRKDKIIVVKNIFTGEEIEENYDYIILSPGAKAILPKSILGISNENVFSVRNVMDVQNLKEYITKKQSYEYCCSWRRIYRG